MPMETALADIRRELELGAVVPYLGPGVLALAKEGCPLPQSAEQLVEKLTAKASVPHKIKANLTAAAQFIENFKHRKTVKSAMMEAFAPPAEPTPLHSWLADLPALPLLVHVWYDSLPQQALAKRKGSWGMIQGVSQAEHFGEWTHCYRPYGAGAPSAETAWDTVLYQPWGSVAPEGNFLVSDSDFVEVLTEIDIQTPIPEIVQRLRTGRNFLFLGCRFANQMDRMFARQIMKRSSAKHWAVLPDPLTKNEARFLAEQDIERIEMPLAEFLPSLTQAASPIPETAAVAGD